MPTDSSTPVERLYAQLRDEKFNPAKAPIRLRVATELASHPEDPRAASSLDELLHDSDSGVREAAIAGLATIFTARPAAVAELNYEDRSLVTLRSFYDAIARFLSGVDSAEALDALLAVLESGEYIDEHEWLLDRVAATARFSNATLEARMEEDERRDPERAVFLAELLARRGNDAGETLLLGRGSRTYIDSLVARGPEGIRTLCRLARPAGRLGVDDEVAERLAAQRKKTEATIFEIARNTSTPGADMAAKTLGYWDSPESVAALLALARDPASSGDVREEALESLAKLEAPEAIELLCEAIADERLDDVTRWTCADGLGAIGNAAALPALESVAKKYRSETLGKSALEAIRSIRG